MAGQVCAKCGAELGNAKFCVKCGTPVAANVDSRAVEFVKQGNAYLDAYKLDKAIKAFAKAIEIDPKYADAYFGRGKAYYRNWSKSTFFHGKDYEKARSDFIDAIRLNPSCAAEAYFILGDYTEAIKANPNYAEAYYQRGNIYHMQLNYNAAVLDYEMAQRLGYDVGNFLEYARQNKTTWDAIDGK